MWKRLRRLSHPEEEAETRVMLQMAAYLNEQTNSNVPIPQLVEHFLGKEVRDHQQWTSVMTTWSQQGGTVVENDKHFSGHSPSNHYQHNNNPNPNNQNFNKKR